MSWKWFERMMYSVLGVSSAAAVSGLVALAVLIAGPPPMWAQSAAPAPPVVLKRVSTPDSAGLADRLPGAVLILNLRRHNLLRPPALAARHNCQLRATMRRLSRFSREIR